MCSWWVEPFLRVVRQSHMTVSVTPRHAVLTLLAVTVLTVVYLMGAARAGGTPAVASTLGRTANASSTPSSSGVATGTEGAGGPGISVAGRADVAGTPDTLRLDASVVVTAASVSEALASANRSTEAVHKSLLGSGVQKKDLATSGLRIAPDYDYSNAGTPRLRGYQVSESVTAKLRDLGRAGDAIGRAVAAGGSAIRVNGISLDLEDTGALVSSARGKAFADARTKAEQYAKAAGRSLGEVVSITEAVSTPSPVAMPYAAMDSAKSASVPIQPGSQDVSVSVSVVFAMR